MREKGFFKKRQETSTRLLSWKLNYTWQAAKETAGKSLLRRLYKVSHCLMALIVVVTPAQGIRGTMSILKRGRERLTQNPVK